MSKTVIALFENAGQALKAVNALKASGFTDERIEVRSGEEFIRQGNMPPVGKPEHKGLYSGIKSFFDEIGLTDPDGPLAGEYRTIGRNDAVIMFETSDERADQAAELLDREGAVDVEERKGKTAKPDADKIAGGLEAKVGGKTPPQDRADYGDIDERSLAGTDADRTEKRRRARVYGTTGDWPPGTGPKSKQSTRH